MKIILLGAPGSGKGTYSAHLQQTLKIPHISTGDLFRQALAKGTQLGLLAHGYWGKGNLVPDDITIGLVKERLGQPDCKNGFILDGFPRTLTQAKSLDDIIQLDLIFHFRVDLQLAMKRLLSRIVCTNCGRIYNLADYKSDVCENCNTKLTVRSDDEKRTIENRFEVYEEVTYPVVGYYKNNPAFREVDSNGSVESVQAKINKIVGELNV